MNDLKTDKKHKRLYFVLSVVSFFAPMITAIACLFPFFDYAVGYKIAIGFVLAILHTSVLAGGMWANVRLHYPMLSPLPFLICMLYGFFTIDFFHRFVYPLLIIEAITSCGMIVSAVFWNKYRKAKIRVIAKS